MLWGRRHSLTALQVVGLREGGVEGGESSSKAICSCVITALGLSWLALCSVWIQGPLTNLYCGWEVNAGSDSYITAYMVLSEEWAVKYLSSWLDRSTREIWKKKKRNKIIRQWFIIWEKWLCLSKSVYVLFILSIYLTKQFIYNYVFPETTKLPSCIFCQG